MLTSHPNSVARQVFERFLIEVKVLIEQKRIKMPSGFISYAWEPDNTVNKKLQAWLSQLKADFKQLGSDLFLDIHQMNGDMRECMRLIAEKDFVLMIGTPRFKERAEQDALYLLPTLNFNVLPKQGNAVVLIENDDTVYFIENGQRLPDDKTVSRVFNVSQVEWIQERGYQRAKISKAANQIIEEAMYPISKRNITNVAFEYGLTCDKAAHFLQNTNNALRTATAQKLYPLIPLLVQGDFGNAFPQGISTHNLIRDFRNSSQYYQNIVSLNPLGLLPAICPALQNDVDYKKLVSEFLEWNFDIWRERITRAFQNELQLYIPARGDVTAECQNPKPMEAHVNDFLQNHAAKVMLLLGGSGSGKTMFGQYLCQQFRQQYLTPIWISLPSLENPKENAIEQGLRGLGVPDSHIPSFKQKSLLIILDGYDEVKNLGNLYESNRLAEWNAKVIITCRSEFLTAKNYNLLFKPFNGNFIERHVSPFSPTEIKAYLQKYIELQHPIWGLNKYQAEIERLPVLKQLMETPFLLRIVADVLPDIADKYQGQKEQSLLTRRALYERFMDQWFEKHIVRWMQQDKLKLLDEGLELDEDNELEWGDQRIAVLRNYAENFAYKLFTAQLDAVSSKADYPWVKELFDTKPRSRLIRSACPLKKMGDDTYGFIHKSLLEYLVTPRMVEEMRKESKGKNSVRYKVSAPSASGASSSSGLSSSSSSLGSSSVSTGLVPSISKVPHHAPNAVTLARLNQQLLTSAIIQFLADAIIEKPELQAGLWSIVDSSKQSESTAIAAANAITILNKARVSLSGKDLSNIRIPGADLTGAICDNTSFQNADFTNVTLTGAWLHGTNFQNALMTGVEFGEYPSIILEDVVQSCCYSFDGKYIGVAAGKNIHLYNGNTHQCVLTIKDANTWKVNNIHFSWDGKILASAGSSDPSIKLWSVKNGLLFKVLEGHTMLHVHCVQFSQNGEWLVSSGYDNTVRLWSIKSGMLVKTLDHMWPGSVAFSPDNQSFVSAGLNTENYPLGIKLWSVPNGNLIHAFRGCGQHGNCIRFSPDGKLLAFAGSDRKTVEIWSIDRKILLTTLEKASNDIHGLHFSPDGNLLAVASSNVTLWFVGNGELFKMFKDATENAQNVHFSPDGERLISNSRNILKVGSVKRGGFLKLSIETHNETITSVVFSDDGSLLGSGSMDATAKIWSTEGRLLKTFGGHDWTVDVEFKGKVFILGELGGRKNINDRAVKHWSLQHGKFLKTQESNLYIEDKLSPDGKLKARFRIGTVELIDVEKNEIYKILEATSGSLSQRKAFCFSSDGRQAALGNWDKTLKLWSLKNGRLLRTYNHTHRIEAVAFSPDGKFIAFSGEDNALKLWDISNLETDIIFYSTDISSSIYCLAFRKSEASVFLATGHNDCSLRYWQLLSVNNQPYLQLLWSTHQNMMLSQNVNISTARGLSPNNLNLLIQCSQRGGTVVSYVGLERPNSEQVQANIQACIDYTNALNQQRPLADSQATLNLSNSNSSDSQSRRQQRQQAYQVRMELLLPALVEQPQPPMQQSQPLMQEHQQWQSPPLQQQQPQWRPQQQQQQLQVVQSQSPVQQPPIVFTPGYASRTNQPRYVEAYNPSQSQNQTQNLTVTDLRNIPSSQFVEKIDDNKESIMITETQTKRKNKCILS